MVSNEYANLVFNKAKIKVKDLDNFVLMNTLYKDFNELSDNGYNKLYTLEKYFFKKILKKEKQTKVFIKKFNTLIKNRSSNEFIIEFLNAHFDLIFEIV